MIRILIVDVIPSVAEYFFATINAQYILRIHMQLSLKVLSSRSFWVHKSDQGFITLKQNLKNNKMLLTSLLNAYCDVSLTSQYF